MLTDFPSTGIYLSNLYGFFYVNEGSKSKNTSVILLKIKSKAFMVLKSKYEVLVLKDHTQSRVNRERCQNS